MSSNNKIFTLEELKQNNGENGNKLWVLIDEKIYDVTEFNHPGGKEILMEDQENDRFDEFESIHSPAAKRQMEKYFIGTINSAKDKLKDTSYVETQLGDIDKKQSSNIVYLLGLIFLLIAAAVGYLKVLKK
jgi:cytochrome b involved in lipid metabolism